MYTYYVPSNINTFLKLLSPRVTVQSTQLPLHRKTTTTCSSRPSVLAMKGAGLDSLRGGGFSGSATYCGTHWLTRSASEECSED